MALDVAGILAAVAGHAQAGGHAERVHGHEIANAPGNGVTASVWLDRIRPVPGRSGLDSTSVLVQLFVRLQMPDRDDDGVELELASAADDLMRAYSGDFNLGIDALEVDLLGAQGQALEARAGYLPQDGRIYRVVTITLPLVVADLWAQAP